MSEDYSIVFYPFASVVAGILIALFVKLMEHVKPRKKLERKPTPQETDYLNDWKYHDLDETVDEEPDDSLIYDDLFDDS